MSAPGLDNALWMLSDAGEILLLAVLLRQRLHKMFPVFTVYILWQFVSDALFIFAIRLYHISGQSYSSLYYSFLAIAYVLEIGVLLEIAANVLSPARESLRKKILYFFLGAIVVVGFSAFLMASRADLTFHQGRTFVVMDTTAAILRLTTFLLLAGFAQVLGLSWKNHVLQLASGLALYSVILLVAQIAQSQLRPGPDFLAQYHFWGEIEATGYFCTLSFWCYAFLKKEAPRKEFSPQMTKILVSISGTAQRQRAALARTRDQLQ